MDSNAPLWGAGGMREGCIHIVCFRMRSTRRVPLGSKEAAALKSLARAFRRVDASVGAPTDASTLIDRVDASVMAPTDAALFGRLLGLGKLLGSFKIHKF